MNIAVGKFGKSVLFNQERWSMKGGDHDMPGLIAVLAAKNPEINFYLISRNDIERLPTGVWDKININKNIFNVWKGETSKEPEIPRLKLKEWGVDIDFGLFWAGPAGTTSLRNKTFTIRTPGKYATPSIMTERYVGPLVDFLNNWGGPYVDIADDVRYFPVRATDLLNKAKFTVGAYDKKNATSMLRFPKYETQERVKVWFDLRNYNLPTWMFASEPDVRLKEPGNRTNLLSIYLNGIGTAGGKNKFKIVRDYIVEQFPTATIYGIWPEQDNPDVVKYPGRFVPTPMAELNDQMYNTKYTLMIANVFCSAKFYKHLMHGMIPFFHPDYPTDVYEPVPEFLKVKDVEDFKKRIEYLENNPDEYRKVWNSCQKLLKDEYFEGGQIQSFFEECIHEYVDKDYKFNPQPNSVKMTSLWPDKYLTRQPKTDATIEQFLA